MSAERRATYRLQLRPEFGFARVCDLAGYLARLGVSHVYLSPCLQARRGSTHGYDVADFGQVNAELGGEEGFTRMCATLREQGLGVLLDFVPNHMAIGRENPWWWDVLENGPSSRYASYFDIEWRHALAEGGLLLPVLGDHCGRVLEAGELHLEREGTRFRVRYAEHAFPVAPRSLPEILLPAAEACGSALLAFLARALDALPLPTATETESVERRHRDKEALGVLLGRLLDEDAAARGAIDAELGHLEGDVERFDGFLARQNYRLAHWRIAARELSYRRFFDIDTLIALRAEDPAVFTATHRRVIEWLRDGLIDGVRIDHIDGLRDPEGYLRRLRTSGARWIAVEKILAPDEVLPSSWPVEGTTGYDFLNLAGGLFVDPAGEEALTRHYRAFTGERADYPSLLLAAKLEVLDRLLGSDLRRLGELLAAICRQHRRQRDHASSELEDALRVLLAQLDVYRTYVRPDTGTVAREDARRITAAVAGAKASRPDLPGDLLDFLADVLLLRETGPAEAEFVERFQQLSGPTMAKGAEDTVFYRFPRLLALNEVGGEPGVFGVAPEHFHAAIARLPARFRSGLLATSTHDTKRSEDVRMRLALLSEIPEEWGAALARWSALSAPYRPQRVDRSAEYMLYQTLVGAWPIDADRAGAASLKAAREAKLHTSWRRPDPEYEDALRDLVARLLADPAFCRDCSAFVERLVPAGRTNSLALTLLKLTAPGIPDLYQGTELWELSLVDPDNRRPVDFARREALLSDLDRADAASVLAQGDVGLPKLWLIQRVLALRRRRPGWLAPEASYRPLQARGAHAAHVVAFARQERCATIVPRLGMRRAGDWKDTSLLLPEGDWHDVLTGQGVAGGERPVREILARFPVALLVREGDPA